MIQKRNESCMTYAVIEEYCSLEEKSWISYGIAVCAAARADGQDRIVEVVHDISASKDQMEHFVGCCNQEGLSWIHLRDAVEDFLVQ